MFIKNRIIWVVSILLAAILYLFENHAGTLTVWMGFLVVPIFGLLPLIGKEAVLEIALNPVQEKGTGAVGTLTVANPSLLPKPRLELTVSCRNLRTGKTSESKLELSLLPKQRKQTSFTIDCPHCGKVELAVTKVTYTDVFGLFERTLPCEAGTAFTILPHLFELSMTLVHSDTTMLDSDIYSPIKSGSDPGETFAVREYVPGDSIRNIHWKLSEKTGKTMVREFGLPVVNEVALLLDTAGTASCEEVDAITEVFASVSSALTGADIHHNVFWQNNKTDTLWEYHITEADGFGIMLEELLELSPKEDSTVVQRFLERYPHCPYSHVVVVGSQIPAGIGDLYNGNRVSILIPHREGVAEGLQSDGIYVLSFDMDRFPLDLYWMEV